MNEATQISNVGWLRLHSNCGCMVQPDAQQLTMAHVRFCPRHRAAPRKLGGRMDARVPDNGTATSKLSAAQLARFGRTFRHAVLVCVSRSVNGMTCAEVEGVTGGRHQTISGALRAMVLAGFVCDTGATRHMNATNRAQAVWIATEEGRAVIAPNLDRWAAMRAARNATPSEDGV